MSIAFIVLAAAGSLLLTLASVIQCLFQESLRLRSREVPSLEYFKEHVEDRLGVTAERGALAFTILKQYFILAIVLLLTAISAGGAAPTWRSLGEAALASLAVLVIVVHIIPQWLYRRTSGEWLLIVAPAMKVLAYAARPVMAVFLALEALARLGAEGEENGETGSSTEQDLEALIDAGAGEGLIEEDDRQLIHSVVTLGDKTVREVMTPRRDLVSIQQDSTIEDFRTLAIHNHFSRIPVYNESIDDITGFVHVRDILKLNAGERATHKVREYVHPTCYVPETKPVDDLFRDMQKENIHMAIVVDEYGDTAGIATMEDVMEEVFGDIRDEYDPEASVNEESEGVYCVSGNVDLDELHELVDFRPDEEAESTTVGGLLMEKLGHVPEIGEYFEEDGVRFEVTQSDERHVKEVRVSRFEDKNKNGNGNGR